MKKHRLLTVCSFAALSILVALGLSACSSNVAPTEAETYSYTDDYNMVSQVPTHPHRVVSLSPAVTEIMFALGADSLLVGRTEFCVYPPEASQIENVGGISNLNVEKVLSLNPDLVISGSMIPRKVVEQFNKMGVPLVSVIEKQHFEALYENIEKIGSLVGSQRAADSLNQVLRNEVASLKLTPTTTPKSVYYVVGFGSGGNFTAGGNTFINDIINMAGGHNIAADSEGWTYSIEALLKADPDIIVIRQEDSATFCRTAPYSQLSAVKQGHLVTMQDGMMDLQVPRNIEVIKRLNAAM